MKKHNGRESDLAPDERALSRRLRDWDPAQRESAPSDAEQAWFRERLEAEARAAEVEEPPLSGLSWRALAALATVVVLAAAVSLLLWPGADPPAELTNLEGPAPEGSPAPREGDDVDVVDDTLDRTDLDRPARDEEVTPEVTATAAADTAIDNSADVIAADMTAADVTAVDPTIEEGTAGDAEPAVAVTVAEAMPVPSALRTRQIHLRAASGTRLVWTFDPSFDWETGQD